MASINASSTSGSNESSTGLDGNLGSPEGSKTPESLSGCHSPGSPGSPIKDDACPICLGTINDKCAAGSCLHYFCLVCLKEWSKQKAVCPLCKQTFTKILYEIKSETDYKEWIVPKKITDPQSFASTLTEFLRSTERSFFGYRTTNTGGLRSHILNVLPRRRSMGPPRRRSMVPYLPNRGILPNGPREMFGSYRNQQRGSSSFRSSIYINNLWVQPLSDITGQYRESSPDLYREQPALTHRLVPWVNREVAALLSPSRVSVVLVEIMDLIERYLINSREFCRAIRPHFGSRTSHFVHEFYNFARSPYDMVGHDNAARYVTRYELENAAASDSEDDEVIEVESNGNPVQPLDLSARPVYEEVLANDGSVIISSGNSSSSDDDEDNNDDNTEFFTELRNPDPPSEYNRCRKNSKSSQRNNERENYNSNFDEPGPSGISSSNITVKRESDENVNNFDECLIVDVLKPKKERTPEIIDLSSDTDADRTKENAAKKTHWKKKISKQVENKCAPKTTKKVKKQPRLDRNSFSLHISGTMNCNHISHAGRLREDHNYCGSASNQNGSELDSEEETEKLKRSCRSHASRKVVSRNQIHLSSFDTETDSDLEIRRREKSVNSRLLIKGTSNRSCLRGSKVDSDSDDEHARYKKKTRPSKNSKVVQKVSSKIYQNANTDSNIDASHLPILNRKSKLNEVKNSYGNDEALKVRRSSRLVNKSYAWDYEFSSDDESEESKNYWNENKTSYSTRSEHYRTKSKMKETKLPDPSLSKKSFKHRSKRHGSKTKTTTLINHLSSLLPDSSSSQNSSRTSYFSSEDSDSRSSITISSICSSSTDSSSEHFKRPSKKRVISFSDSSLSDNLSFGSLKNKDSKKKSLNRGEFSEKKSKKRSKKVKELSSKTKSKEIKKKKKYKTGKKHSKRTT